MEGEGEEMYLGQLSANRGMVLGVAHRRNGMVEGPQVPNILGFDLGEDLMVRNIHYFDLVVAQKVRRRSLDFDTGEMAAGLEALGTNRLEACCLKSWMASIQQVWS